nr:uncharacterized protein CTRU02_13829 [Colletotrichum truncatum]XP_036579062.1 uncharacterized protein CTRU02_10991 [Colletotrichum truncatum]KAF6782831.1 hypothetical protein CTRU02_13829 [Colletotrichum truncatum]KAF6786493.1 hypothetical protein CTRU02_10991 [Colletotrichum truncatum]
MSEPTAFGLSRSTDSAGQAWQETAQSNSKKQHALSEEGNPQSEPDGPLKQVIAHRDSLYKYINWEEPGRTLGAYTGVMGVLFGIHYLPITQVALKVGMLTLGVVSVLEFVTRPFSTRPLSALLRPKEFKRIPESTLNATLKDIHDFTQYIVVEFQRVVLGQDLKRTFAAFISVSALYWLVHFLSPFWLTFMGLNSIFIAPLLASPEGRRVASDASLRAQELVNATADRGKEVAQNSQAKISDLASFTTTKGNELAHDASTKTAEWSSKAQQTVYDSETAIKNVSKRGMETASDLSARAKSTAIRAPASAKENVGKISQTGMNAAKKAPESVNSALGNTKQYISNLSANQNIKNFREKALADQSNPLGEKTAQSDGHSIKTPSFANSAAAADEKNDWNSSMEAKPVRTTKDSNEGLSSGTDTDPEYAAVARHAATTRDAQDRPPVPVKAVVDTA